MNGGPPEMYGTPSEFEEDPSAIKIWDDETNQLVTLESCMDPEEHVFAEEPEEFPLYDEDGQLIIFVTSQYKRNSDYTIDMGRKLQYKLTGFPEGPNCYQIKFDPIVSQ